MKQQEFLSKIEDFCRKEQLFEDGDRVVAGVSGGADSMCLLNVLIAMKLPVIVVHVNHGIRKEAGEDAAYVETFCRERQIPFYAVCADIPAEAERRKLSEEEAGREIRYETFERIRRELGADKIALAHHRDDQAETLLWNLFRGSGAAGLSGISPRRDRIVRPLLGVSREEIEAYLTAEGISWKTDRTNLETAYTRNRIRNVLLPQIEETLNERAAEHIARTAEDLRLVQEYLKEQTEAAMARCVFETMEGSLCLHKERWAKEAPAIRTAILKELLIRCAGAARDITRRHIQLLEELLELQVGKMLDLPYNCKALRTYEGLSLRKGMDANAAPASAVKGRLLFEILEVAPGEDPLTYAGEKRYTKCFDYAIIKYHPVLRTREAGDYLIIDDRGSRQKLKQFFINEKIPAEVRESIPLAAIGSEILWIVGYRMGEHGKITEATRKILRVTYQPDPI